ncbi:hypothetical protein BH23CHL2_BH23CHL2_07380 [soil metagenome]
MAKQSSTYNIDPELEDALLTAAAADKPVRVKGSRTHLVRLERSDIWADYDPDALIRVVQECAEDPYRVDLAELEDLIADLRAAREQDSIGRPARG